MNKSNKIHYDKIQPDEVLKELESHDFSKEIFENILKNVKETSAYIELKEIALLNFSQIMSGENDSQDNDEILRKRKSQTAQIGFLSAAIGPSITKFIHESLNSKKANIRTVIMEIITKLYAEHQSSVEETESSINVLPKLSSFNKNISNKESPLTKLSKKSKRSISEETDILSDPSMHSQHKRLSQRKRKPNLKYYSEDIISSRTASSSDDDINT